MSKKTVILVLFQLICIFFIFSQISGQGRVDLDFGKFQQTFKKEISNDTSHLVDPVLHPASIPEILLNIPESSDKKIYIIGISDPGMGLEPESYQLALLRGKMLLTLLNKPEVGVITDNFTSEQNNSNSAKYSTRYAGFFNLKAELTIDTANLKIEAYNISSFNELVILLSYSLNSSNQESHVISEANLYQNERQKQVSFDNEGKFSMKAVEKMNSQENRSTSYEVVLLNKTADIQTILNEQSILFPYRNYRYVSESVIDNEEFVGSKLTFGLWKAFSESLLKEICLISQNNDVEIKQVDDNYNEGKQSLSREILISNTGFRLQGISVNDNMLSVEVYTSQ